MADTNNERVGKALALLSQGVAPFVERECTRALGENWENTIETRGSVSKSDTQFLLLVMRSEWHGCFIGCSGMLVAAT